MGKSVKLKFKAVRDTPIYLVILPAFLLLLVFNYVPIYGLIMAFEDFSPFKGVFRSEFIGFKNFIYFLSDDNFWRVIRNTIIINFYQLVFGYPVPIIFAIFLSELTMKMYKKFVQTVSYLPYFISWVVAAGIFVTILSPDGGIINIILDRIFGMDPIYFMTKEKYFRGIIVTSHIWKSFGMSAVYYLATIASIDPGLYESAKMDGAGRMKQIWHITLPGIKSISIVLLVLQIGTIMNIGFEQIFLMYNPMVYNVGDVISTYIYRLGIEQARFSLTTAIGFAQSIVNFILVFSANRLAKKIAGWSLW